MGKDAITFGDIEVKNRKFHRYKKIFLNGVNIDNILVSARFLLARKVINISLVN